MSEADKPAQESGDEASDTPERVGSTPISRDPNKTGPHVPPEQAGDGDLIPTRLTHSPPLVIPKTPAGPAPARDSEKSSLALWLGLSLDVAAITARTASASRMAEWLNLGRVIDRSHRQRSKWGLDMTPAP